MVRSYANPELQLTTLLSIVVDLEDMQAVMEGDAENDTEHNSPEIHLERWAGLKWRAMSASHHNLQFTEQHASHMAKDYLMAGLQRVLARKNFDEEATSLILRAEEDKIMRIKAGF